MAESRKGVDMSPHVPSDQAVSFFIRLKLMLLFPSLSLSVFYKTVYTVTVFVCVQTAVCVDVARA